MKKKPNPASNIKRTTIPTAIPAMAPAASPAADFEAAVALPSSVVEAASASLLVFFGAESLKVLAGVAVLVAVAIADRI